MIRPSAIVAACVLAAAFAAVGARAQTPAIPKLATPQVVKIGLTGKPITFAGVYVAISRGYFKESGITNEFVIVGGFNALLGPLATGEIDIGIGGVSASLFNAVERGVQLRVVADVHTAFTGRSAIALMVRKDIADAGQIKDYASLKGRTIALTGRRTSLELVLLRTLRSAGLGPSDVNLVVMPFGQINAAFAGRTIEVGYQVEPLVAAAVAQNLAVRWRGLDEMQPNYQNSFLVSSERFASREELARAWMIAYLRGVRDYNDAMFKGKDKEAVIKILMEHTLVKARRTYDDMVMPGINPDGEVNVASIVAMAEDLKAAGDIKPDTNVERVIDMSFVRSAQRVLGAYPK